MTTARCSGRFSTAASHTDTLLLEYFTENAWSKDAVGHLKVLDGFCAGRRGSDGLAEKADEIVFLAEKMADLLELHTDYSIWESYERLDGIEKIRNPNFKQVLLENAICSYCRSHQYEAARYLYLTRAKSVADRIKSMLRRVANGGQLTAEEKTLRLGDSKDIVNLMLAVPLEAYRPTKPRTPENFRALMRELADHVAKRGT